MTLAARCTEKLELTVDALREMGLSAERLTLDLQDVEEVDRIVASCGPFDVLVNSAGLARHGPALETTQPDFDAVVRINLRGAYFVTRAVAKKLIATGKPGSLINISDATCWRH